MLNFVFLLIISIIVFTFALFIHEENKMQLECNYYMQWAIQNNKEDKIKEYQPQCADYLSFLD